MSNKVYIRKVMKHDMTHEVSITSYVYYDFFEGVDEVFFQIDGKGYTYNVTFNNATDLRFGGDFKSMCRILDVKEGDYLIVSRTGNNLFSISIERKNTLKERKYAPFFTGTRRHIIAIINGNDFNVQYVR